MSVDEKTKSLRITEFSTPELIQELMNRFPAAVFLGLRMEEWGELTNVYQWTGSNAVCEGLCHSMASYVKQEILCKELNMEEEE